MTAAPDHTPDRRALTEHVEMLHTLAAPLADHGKLILATYGNDPATGLDIPPKVEHFAIGDAAGMVAAIERLGREPHRNVYIPLTVMRGDLLSTKKGGEDDVIGVLGVVGDFDDADAANYPARLPMAPNYVMETSAGRFQAVYLFDEPQPLTEAKAIGQALQRAAKCDFGTKDMCHVWRVAGTLNYPNAKKVKEGRSPAPQVVRVASFWGGDFTSAADLREALAATPEPQARVIDFNTARAAHELPQGLINLMSEPVAEGERSERAHAVFCALVERGWTDAQILDEVSKYPNGFMTRFGGNRSRILADIDRARSKAKGDRKPGSTTQAAPKSAEEWPEPGDLRRLAHVPAPAFPSNILPDKANRWAVDVAERMQCPVDFVALPMMVAMAGLIGKDAGIRLKAKDDWTERACLWGMVIASKGSSKSPALKEAVRPLNRIEKALSIKFDEDKRAWEVREAERSARLKAWEKQRDTILAKDPGGDIPPMPTGIDKAEEAPICPRLISNNATVEKLGVMMEKGRGLSLILDELAGLMLNMSRYNTGSDRPFYLECHSGGAYQVDRMGRDTLFIPDTYLNIFGGIQPDVARRLFSVEPGTDDGFLERFGLMAYPEVSTSWENIDRQPDIEGRNRYNDLCQRLAEANWFEVLNCDQSVLEGHAKPFCRLSGEAQEIFDSWLIDHMKAVRSIAADDPISGMMAKARGLVGRLALVLHLAAWASGETASPMTVEPLALTRALTLLEDYLIPTWRRVMASFSKSLKDNGAMRIARMLTAKRLESIRPADITKLDWSGLRDREAVMAALGVLVDNDWLAEPERASGSKGGRPSERFMVNPKALRVQLGDAE